MSTRKTGGIRLLLAFLALLGVGIGAIPLLLVPPAGLELRLVDERFGTDLSGTTLQVVDPDRDLTVGLAVERDAGGYVATIERIRSGPVSLQLSLERFEPTAVNFVLPALEMTRHEVSLVPSFGRLEVSVVNARSPEHVVTRRAAVEVDGTRSVAGDDVLFVALDPGRHQVEADASGFCPGDRQVEVRKAETTKLLLPLSPEVSGAERARMVLDWGENPRDLDAHVIVSGASKRVKSSHVFFKNLRGLDRQGNLYLELDVDWRNSEGFETVTVYDPVGGVFQYFIHHYAGSGSLGESNARVELITAGCERRRFTVLEPCDKLFWYVADLKVEGTERVIVERNRCQDEMPIQWKSGKADD